MVDLSLIMLGMLRRACRNQRDGLGKKEDGKEQGRRTEEFITSETEW